jgi:zinc protease
MRKLTLFFALLLSVGSLFAQAKLAASDYPQYQRTIEGIKEYSLKNGLKILLIPDATQSNVVVNIVYNVGSRHEGYGEKGMAHLLEHMLFKSTKNLGDIKKMLSEKGANANGTTWYDRTNYYEVFPSNEENLRWSLQMEADRMLNATMLQSDLDKEFSVVRNEFEISENYPSRVLEERIISTAYLWHNYGNSTIGSKEDIERVKADRLKVFYEKYYQPDNATLIIAGKFDEKVALDAVSEYFGGLARPTRVLDKTYTVEPAQDGERYVELKRSGDIQLIGAVYHAASYADKDTGPLDALIEILTSDPSGYLYKALVDTHKASGVYAYQPTLRDPGFVYFSIEVPKDKDFEDAKSTFLSKLDSIPYIPYTQEDVNRAKAKLLKYIENRKNNTLSTAIGLTEIIGAGDYRLYFLYRDAIENLTLDDVKRVAERYFKANNRTYGIFLPAKDELRVKPDELLDSNIAELTSDYKGKAEEIEDLSFEPTIENVKANLTTGTLDNGFKYGFIKKPIKGKKVVASFRIPVGNLKDLTGKQTIASVMSSLLTAGTKTMTKEQIEDQLDQLKSQISLGFGGQDLAIRVSTYQEFLQPTFELLHQLLTESIFPENEFNKTITNYKASIEQGKNEPQSIVFREISRKTSPYTNGHPFYTPSPDEEIAGLDAVSRQDVINFYQTILGGEHGLGTVVGDLDAATVKTLLASTFGDWKSSVAYEKILPQYMETKASDELINTPDKENAAAVGAIAFRMDRKNPDYPAMVMANEMLGQGGFLTARIPTRLREKEGISYGAGSFQSIPYDNDVAQWGLYAFFNPTVQSKVDAAIKEEINNALKDGFTKEELDNTLKGWLNERAVSLGTDNFLINLVNGVLYYGNSLDDYTDLETKVKALNVETINKAMAKYLSSDKLILIYAGDFNKK